MSHAYEPRYDWIDYPDADPGDGLFEWLPEHVGVKVRLLANPTGAQVRAETAVFLESGNADLDKQDAYWQHIAARIIEWNLATGDGSGAVVDLPPPAERWESLLDLEFNLQMWLRITVHLAHRPKVLARLRSDAGGTATTRSTSPSLASSPA